MVGDESQDTAEDLRVCGTVTPEKDHPAPSVSPPQVGNAHCHWAAGTQELSHTMTQGTASDSGLSCIQI